MHDMTIHDHVFLCYIIWPGFFRLLEGIHSFRQSCHVSVQSEQFPMDYDNPSVCKHIYNLYIYNIERVE